MSTLKKLLDLTPFGILFDWISTLRHAVGIGGAIFGVCLTCLSFLFDGVPEASEEVFGSLFVGAFLGTFWFLLATMGWANGFQRSMLGWGFGLGAFMVLAAWGDPDTSLYSNLCTGAGLGTLFGAWLPLAWIRLGCRLERKSPLRKFSLLLALPIMKAHDDNWTSLATSMAPFEAEIELQERWNLEDGYELESLIEELTEEQSWGELVEVARWGFMTRRLDKQEAWSLIERAGRSAFAHFDSWEQFAETWQAWESDEERPIEESLDWAKTSRKSPWQKREWPKGIR